MATLEIGLQSLNALEYKKLVSRAPLATKIISNQLSNLLLPPLSSQILEPKHHQKEPQQKEFLH